ncbi:MAG: sigma-70 family RNA polymerase sigma factor [Bacteroidales bacterium]
MTRADFNDLVKKLNRKLYLYAFRILKNQAGAEDAVQEVFLKLWKMNTQPGEYNSIDALATTMVKNYCIDQLRKLKFTESDNISGYSLYQTTDPSPHEQLERNDTILILERIIEALPENYRNLIRLRDIEGFSYEEISEKTQLNINALRVNLSRARKIVRNEFIKYSDELRGNKKTTGEIL